MKRFILLIGISIFLTGCDSDYSEYDNYCKLKYGEDSKYENIQVKNVHIVICKIKDKHEEKYYPIEECFVSNSFNCFNISSNDTNQFIYKIYEDKEKPKN